MLSLLLRRCRHTVRFGVSLLMLVPCYVTLAMIRKGALARNLAAACRSQPLKNRSGGLLNIIIPLLPPPAHPDKKYQAEQ